MFSLALNKIYAFLFRDVFSNINFIEQLYFTTKLIGKVTSSF